MRRSTVATMPRICARWRKCCGRMIWSGNSRRGIEWGGCEREANDLLPFCYPTPGDGAGLGMTVGCEESGKAQQTKTFRDGTLQERTAIPEFQDRCLKPL